MSINVLVVDDSSVMRMIVSDILKEDTSINVVDRVNNGKEALEKTKSLHPDVVVMDMIMGTYDGLYGVKRIMKEVPTPIVLLSSIGNSDMSPIMEALNEGAFDYLNKPANRNTRIRDIGNELRKKVHAAATADIKKLGRSTANQNISNHTFADILPYDIIVIGSSTGGPTAVEKVISKLPGNLTIPVVIAQHMPENFVGSFVTRLDRLTPLRVVEGIVETEVLPGQIIIAPGNRNMILKRKGDKVVTSFTHKRYDEYNDPSVNALFESAVEVYGAKVIGAILTGMGKDGTLGIQSIKNGGGYTIAQDEATSVVFGMPKEAIKSGCVDSVIPIHEIGNFVVSCLS